MSLTRITQMLTNSTNCAASSSSDDTSDDSMTINWDKNATIGISSILGGMFIISTSLLILMKRKDLQYTFNAVFKKSRSDQPYQSVYIRELQLEKSFSYDELLEIKELGEHAFLERYLSEVIEQKQRKNEYFASNNLVNDFLEAIIVGKESMAVDTAWHMPTTTTITVKKNAHKRFYLFEKILPPLMVSASLYELVFSMPESIGAISLSPNYLPISDTANQDLNYFKVFISLPKSIIFMFFMNFQIIFSGTYGAQLDDKIVEAYDWLRHPNTDFIRNLCKPSELHGRYWWTHQAFNLLKFVLMVSLICEIDVEIESDLQTMKSINQRIVNNTSTGIPVWLLYFSAWLNFAHNQMNDPSNMITEAILLFGFARLVEQKILQKWRLNDSKINNQVTINGARDIDEAKSDALSPRARLSLYRPRDPDLEASLIESDLLSQTSNNLLTNHKG
jgi:hypothetical protein